jgi:uncharacterized protein YndB with AHSA1/START domain
MANKSALTFERSIKVPVDEVYRAFTNATALREWMCDTATMNLIVGGHIYMAWNNGFYCAGEFLSIKPKEEIIFTSRGRNEPGITQISVKFLPKKNSTTIIITHSGMKPVWKWRKDLLYKERCWNNALRFLVATLEKGADLRIIERPMLGIYVDGFDADIAKKLNVPVTEGVRLGAVLDGMGAKACGLQKDDVIISMAGKPVTNFNSIALALSGHKAGDKVEVQFYRGPVLKTVTMPLSHRPIPKIPSTPAALSQALKKIQDADFAAVSKSLKGVSNKAAAKKPAKNEWSANEILAHLIEGERGWHDFIHNLVFSQERVSDGFADNLYARILADITAYPTTKDLLLELRRSQILTVALLKNLSKEFSAHKGSYWKLGFALLQPNTHTQEHIIQIESALTKPKMK